MFLLDDRAAVVALTGVTCPQNMVVVVEVVNSVVSMPVCALHGVNGAATGSDLNAEGTRHSIIAKSSKCVVEATRMRRSGQDCLSLERSRRAAQGT